MKELIDNVFSEKQITQKEKNDTYSLYEKDGAEFYFLIEISLEQLKAIKTFSDFENTEVYKLFKVEYNKWLDKGTYPAIEKNSSLIILVKGEVSDLEKCQQQILLLEEDEFFFKKYVLLYTDGAVESIRSLHASGGLPALQGLVNNSTKFDYYATSGFVEDLKDYLLVMQLFIKLPFLSLDLKEENFLTLQERLDTNLEEKGSKLYKSLLEKNKNILELDFKSKDVKTEIEELLKLFTDD